MVRARFDSNPRFDPNPRFPQELLHATLLVDDLRAVAEDIAEHARAIAPVDPTDESDYKGNVEADAGLGPKGVEGIVRANDPISGFIEWGTSDTPTFAPLRRGAEAAGYRLRSS